MEPIVYIKKGDQYGRVVYYPDCDASRVFAEIAGTKTLTMDVIKRIKLLGYKVMIPATDMLL